MSIRRFTVENVRQDRTSDISAMYMGTAVNMIPTATPPNTRAPYRACRLGTNPTVIQETVDRIMLNRIVFFRPSLSSSAPASIGPMAAPSVTSEPTQLAWSSVIRSPVPHSPFFNLSNVGDDQVSAQPAASAPMFTVKQTDRLFSTDAYEKRIT